MLHTYSVLLHTIKRMYVLHTYLDRRVVAYMMKNIDYSKVSP